MQAFFAGVLAKLGQWAIKFVSGLLIEWVLKRNEEDKLADNAEESAKRIRLLRDKYKQAKSTLEKYIDLGDKEKINEYKKIVATQRKNLKDAGIRSNSDFIK